MHYFEVIQKSIAGWIEDTLQNVHLSPHFAFDGERKFKRCHGQWMRVIDQPWTANDIWNAWVPSLISCSRMLLI
jgi:hypothetical protein